MAWSTSERWVRLEPWNRFRPSSKIFLLAVPRRYFFCGSFVLFMSCVCHAFVSVHCCPVVTCWERGKGWPLGSCLWCLIVILPLSHVVFRIRCGCGTLLCKFLIFAVFLTSKYIECHSAKDPPTVICYHSIRCKKRGTFSVVHVYYQ